MAKKSKQSEDIRYAVNKKALKQARAQAAQNQAKQEQRLENRAKSRHMGTVFLLGVLSLVALFCIYTLFRVLFFRRASSLEDLRGSLLFVSLVSIPYLLGFGGVLVHWLLKKRREGYSDRGKRLSTLLLVLVLAAAFILFGVQLRGGQSEASSRPAYANTMAALNQSGLEFSAPDSASLVRTLLEDSLRVDLLCGRSLVRINYHADGSARIPIRFLNQAALDYADFPKTEPREGVTQWGPVETGGSARAALAELRGSQIRIVELIGPKAELETLLPLLAASVIE